MSGFLGSSNSTRIAILENLFEQMQKNLSEQISKEDKTLEEIKNSINNLVNLIVEHQKETEKSLIMVKDELIDRAEKQFSTKAEVREAITGARRSIIDDTESKLRIIKAEIEAKIKEDKAELEKSIGSNSKEPIKIASAMIAAFTAALVVCAWLYVNILKDVHYVESKTHNSGFINIGYRPVGMRLQCPPILRRVLQAEQRFHNQT